MRTKTLIIGQDQDAHVKKIVELLESKGKEVLIINKNSLQNFLSVTFTNSNSSVDMCLHYEADNTPVTIDKVWWRNKPFFLYEFSGAKEFPYEKFRNKEWYSVFYSLEKLMPKTFWVNSAIAQFQSSKKTYQLKIAQEVGLSIPKTLITNNAKQVLEFFKKDDVVVYKTLEAFISPPDYMVFTTEVSRETILKNEDSISLSPCTFQERIEKLYELRITVVGNTIYAIKIDSQKQEDTLLDWRKNQLSPMYSLTELEQELKDRLLEMHKKLGLVFGAYDFIVDKNNTPIFLECNPVGQWLWLEDILDIPISDTLAEILK